MMERLEDRAAAMARAKQRREIARIAEALRADLPGAGVREDAAAVVLTGKRLARRWLTDPALRFIAARRG